MRSLPFGKKVAGDEAHGCTKVERKIVSLALDFPRDLDEAVLAIDVRLHGTALKVNRPRRADRELAIGIIDDDIVIAQHGRRQIDFRARASTDYCPRNCRRLLKAG